MGLCETTPYKGALKIELLINKSSEEELKPLIEKLDSYGIDRDSSNFGEGVPVCSFLIYGQNNCCGALSTSQTQIDYSFRNCGLGELLQYFKEDLAVYQSANLITCTDVYWTGVTQEIMSKLDTLKPYLSNTKLLLKTGWTVTDLFWNYNSNNVVGLFTKKVYRNREEKLDVIMKLKINTNKIVKVDIKKVTIGGDPELFLKSKETGEYVPSFFVMEGDKYNPTDISKEGHNIQCDNVMVEYGIPPCITSEEFVKHNQFVQKYLNDKVAEPNNLKMIIFPSARFEEQNLLDDRAKKFGCDPDYNAWENSKQNIVGNTNTPWRCAGGHIHVGYPDHNYATNVLIIRAMDLFLSVPLVLMEPDNKRKEMYGKAGAFRHQKHGVEYRVTSNFIYSSEELMKWAFDQTINALKFINTDKGKSQLSISSGLIINCINNKDKELAKQLISKYTDVGVSTLEVSETIKK
jgi:hypothetical protein